jgi:flagellar protein FlaG
MEGSGMRIQSMDAAIKQTVNVTPAEVKQEPAVDPAKLLPNSGREVAKEAQQKEKYIEEAEQVSDAFIMKAIDKVNHTFEMQKRSLRFQIHERTNEVIVKVVDSETEEVIREIPPEKLLDMFANMLELAGLIVDERR